MDDVPEIRFPSEPCPAAWQEVVTALAERARIVEGWAEETRDRAWAALRRQEDAFLLLAALYDDGRDGEARATVMAAREHILACRGELPAGSKH